MSIDDNDSIELPYPSIRIEDVVSNPLIRPTFIIIQSILLIIVGTIYLTEQLQQTELSSTDIGFVLLLGSSSLVLAAMMFILPRWFALSYYEFFTTITDEEEGNRLTRKQLEKMFPTGRMVILGCIWAVGVGTVPFSPLFDIINPDSVVSGAFELTLLLAIFMGLANFLLGSSFYSLLVYFLTTYQYSKDIEIKLSDVDNIPADFFTDSNFRIATGVSIYVTISIASILFSHMVLGWIIYAYSIFSAAIILFAYIAPTWPLTIAEKDARALFQKRMDVLLSESLRQIEDGDDSFVFTQEQHDNFSVLTAMKQLLEQCDDRKIKLVRKLLLSGLTLIPVVAHVTYLLGG